MRDFWQRYVAHNFGLKVLSLGLAVGLWYAVASDQPAELAVNVPIEFYNIPNNLEINSEHIPEAQVRVRGPARLIHQFRSTDVHVEVNLANAAPGERTVDLTARQVRQRLGPAPRPREPDDQVARLGQVLRQVPPHEPRRPRHQRRHRMPTLDQRRLDRDHHLRHHKPTAHAAHMGN